MLIVAAADPPSASSTQQLPTVPVVPRLKSSVKGNVAVVQVVVPLGTLESADSFGTSSEVLIAKKYVVLALSIETVNASLLPATCGEGSPVA